MRPANYTHAPVTVAPEVPATLVYRAPCPDCGREATYHARRVQAGPSECSEVTRIVCRCKPTDPQPLVAAPGRSVFRAGYEWLRAL